MSGARGGRLLVHLLLRPEDAAPVLVFGNRHAALDAHVDSLDRRGFLGEQLLEKGHDRAPSVTETEKTVRRFAATAQRSGEGEARHNSEIFKRFIFYYLCLLHRLASAIADPWILMIFAISAICAE